MVEQGHIKGLKGIARCLVLKGAVGGGFAGDAAGFWGEDGCCQFMQLQGDAVDFINGDGQRVKWGRGLDGSEAEAEGAHVVWTHVV